MNGVVEDVSSVSDNAKGVGVVEVSRSVSDMAKRD